MGSGAVSLTCCGLRVPHLVLIFPLADQGSAPVDYLPFLACSVGPPRLERAGTTSHLRAMRRQPSHMIFCRLIRSVRTVRAVAQSRNRSTALSGRPDGAARRCASNRRCSTTSLSEIRTFPPPHPPAEPRLSRGRPDGLIQRRPAPRWVQLAGGHPSGTQRFMISLYIYIYIYIYTYIYIYI